MAVGQIGAEEHAGNALERERGRDVSLSAPPWYRQHGCRSESRIRPTDLDPQGRPATGLRRWSLKDGRLLIPASHVASSVGDPSSNTGAFQDTVAVALPVGGCRLAGWGRRDRQVGVAVVGCGSAGAGGREHSVMATAQAPADDAGHRPVGGRCGSSPERW